ncbi:MAG TPA: UvrD-helicase domain-containing protein, partial [Burkholderiaceae bacterium]|nr:UvrD-helicase domain-containing protein [Burkholderiaceae bacterium]
MNLLEHLNERQLAAVTLPDQPALILAGAGSGKTRVLTTRIAWLIQTGRASPHSILAVTFTNKAAKEMLTRISAMLPINTRGMWVGTFHGLCNRLLRAHHRDAGLPSTFQILDTTDQLAAIKRLLKANNVDDERYPPRNLQYFINNAKENGLRADAVEVNDEYNRRFIELYRLYDEQCQREGVVDFAELLLRCYELLARNEPLRTHYQSRFKHILVDEFQDTNTLQYKWLKLLAGRGVGTSPSPSGGAAVFAVGDDDQCVLAGTLITMADGQQKPVEQLKIGDVVKAAIGGGALGPAKVSRVHYRTGVTELVTLKTKGGRELTTTPEHVHFAGFTGEHMPAKFFVYLMNKRNIGFRLALSGHRNPGRHARTVPGFRHRARKEGGDRIWIINSFDDEREARIELTILSLKYGVPTLPFDAGGAPQHRRAEDIVAQDADAVARIYSALNTERGARWLLNDLGIPFDQPQERAQPFFGQPGDVLLNMCSDLKTGRPNHRIYARIRGDDAAERVRTEGWDVKPVVDG